MKKAILLGLALAAEDDMQTEAKGEHALQMWTYTNTLTNNAAEDPTTAVTTLGGDLGIQYEISVAYTAGDKWTSNQKVSVYLGGLQTFVYTQKWFSLEL